MPLRCFSDASQMPLSLSGDSQMSPDPSQLRYLSAEMPLRCFPDASKMILQGVSKENKNKKLLGLVLGSLPADL